MPDLLLELFSEEIPARMQGGAAKDLERLVVGALSDRGLLFEAAKSFAGPRRLTLAIAGLPAKQPDVSEELKGPKVDAPQAALDGFLRKTGLAKERLKVEKTPKGDVYIGVIAREGRATAEVLSEILPETFAKLPWPKSMRFPGSQVRWVRPLHGIVGTLDGEVVPFAFAGVTSDNVTYGHRFLSHGPIKVRRFEDYEEKLRKAHVILDAAERKEIIVHEAKQKAFALGLELVDDAGLLEEVAGLAEWPVVLMGHIEDEFMSLPPEILRTSMRTHQKYFALSTNSPPPTRGGVRGGGTLANRFVVVANMIAEDGGKEIVAGNERVLRARLSDAKFFWDQDRKRTLESRVDDLKAIVFHAKLRTQYERVERIEALAGEIAEKIGADVEKAKRAARLCKADLTTGVVGEFPELQGVMGRYYALHDGEDADVADAIRDHYKPLGPKDAVSKNKVSIAVALADKLDQLVGFFAVGEEPTGSGDPYALRRAAIGMIRTLDTNTIRLQLRNVIGSHAQRISSMLRERINSEDIERISDHRQESGESDLKFKLRQQARAAARAVAVPGDTEVTLSVLPFLATRLSVALSSEGLRTDCVRAVFVNTGDLSEKQRLFGEATFRADDMWWLAAVTKALQAFLKTDDGANLLVAYRRAANILRDEEKRDNCKYDGEPNPKEFVTEEEVQLFSLLGEASQRIRADVQHEQFVEAMGVMARLRQPVDAFFDKVTVNDKNPDLRKNRLKLLSRLRATLHLVADFSKIEG